MDQIQGVFGYEPAAVCPPCQGGIFVPVQPSGKTVSPAQALHMGTAFMCLYSPWEKGECRCG